MNTPIPDHPLVGTVHVFGKDRPPTEVIDAYTIVGNGHHVKILQVYEDWNDIPGLTMLYVRCIETGMSTNISLTELGITEDGHQVSEPEEETFSCYGCSEDVPESDMVTDDDGNDWCQSCADDDLSMCEGCSRSYMSTDMFMIGYDWHCESCSFVCNGCGDRESNDNAINIDYSEYCEACVEYCEYCDEYRESGHSCRGGDGTLQPYGHTYPSMWLGGPLPKDKDGHQIGYYLGIELEISSEYPSAVAVENWAGYHLEDRQAFVCKEDSTVEGFEIVSQPMTPDYFESVNWESFFDMLNSEHAVYDNEEPIEHGLHVHIGRVAFERDDFNVAAFSYLLGQEDHLERIGRREPTGYCNKVAKPASAAILSRKRYSTAQGRRLEMDTFVGRDAINHQNGETVEIRAFKSTRSANELRDAVRLVYLAAEYIRHLRPNRQTSVSPDALHWSQFCRWVLTNHPYAFDSIAGVSGRKGSNRKPADAPRVFPAVEEPINA